MKQIEATEERYSARTLRRLAQDNGAMQRYSGTEPTAFLIFDGKDTEIVVQGNLLVEFLSGQRDELYHKLNDAKAALERHGIRYDLNVVSLADQIDMLAGRLG